MGCGSSAVPGSDCTKPGNVYNPGITPRDDEAEEKRKKKQEKKEKKAQEKKAQDQETAGKDDVSVAPVDGGGGMDKPASGGMPEKVERRLSMQQNERRRSMSEQEDAEFKESEKENIRIVDPMKAATMEHEEKQKSKDIVGISKEANAKLDKLGAAQAERRRSMTMEENAAVPAEAPSEAPSAVEPDSLPAPEFEEDGAYSMGLVSGADAAAEAPKLATEAPEGANAERRASLEESERRRSIQQEDQEWQEAESEQQKILEDAAGEGAAASEEAAAEVAA